MTTNELPAQMNTLQLLSTRVGLAALYLFAFSGGWSTAGIYSGLALMLLALLPQAPLVWRKWRGEHLFWWVILLTAYLLVTTAWSAFRLPSLADEQWRSGWGLVIIGGPLTLVTAWWIGGDERLIRRVLLLALAGFVLGLCLRIDWQQLPNYLHGVRMTHDVHYDRSPNATGLYTAISLLGLFVFTTWDWHHFGRRQKVLVAVLGGVLAVVLLQLLIFSQSRAAWLGFVPLMLAIVLLYARRHGFSSRYQLLVLGVGLSILVALLWYYLPVLEKRVVEQYNNGAVMTRFELWRIGLAAFVDRPLLGWGGGSVEYLLRQGNMHAYPHLHNLYLQMLVTIGGIGALLFAVVYGHIVRRAWRVWRQGRISEDIALFLAAATLQFLIAAFFQVRHDEAWGKYFIILIGAIAASYRLLQHRAQTSGDSRVR
jgi:O-antigen ligase